MNMSATNTNIASTSANLAQNDDLPKQLVFLMAISVGLAVACIYSHKAKSFSPESLEKKPASFWNLVRAVSERTSFCFSDCYNIIHMQRASTEFQTKSTRLSGLHLCLLYCCYMYGTTQNLPFADRYWIQLKRYGTNSPKLPSRGFCFASML